MNAPIQFTHLATNGTQRMTGRDPRAANLFDRAYRNPQPNRFQKWLGRQIQPLLCLQDMVANRSLSNRYHAGTRAIAVDQIHGTLNRSDDFDYDFHPLQGSAQSRWSHVASAMLNGISLPPIEVIQVGDTYFVKDGHHRISVARALGFRYLDAIVEVWA